VSAAARADAGAPSAAVPPAPLAAGRFSPLTRRRWANFKANRRGYWSFWIFLVLFATSIFAELIANDRPIVASYKGELIFPVVKDYPEEKFGGFLAVTNYRSPEIQKELAENGWAIWPPIRFSYDTARSYPPAPAPAPPTWHLSEQQCRENLRETTGRTDGSCRDIEWNWLGTDGNNRDVLANIIYGFRLSIVFALILTFLSSVVGVLAGAVQGYFGGWTDLIFQRVIEVWTAVPALYLLIIVASVLTPSFFILLGILLLFSWVSLVGVVRAEFLRARNLEYVRAARALGLSNATIMFKHLLPNAMVATLTFLPFLLNGAIATLTSLDFLGFGLPLGSPSLGALLAQGKENPQAPWLGLTAFAVVSIMLSLLIFMGEAVRDAFDPRKTFG
jgi:microcin C transport system permease protein